MESLFSVGERVVCVDSSGKNVAPLIEGKVYTIKKIAMNCSCGSVTVDVGFTCNFSKLICGGCSCGYNHGSTHWLRQTRFIPLQADEEIESQAKEALVEHFKSKKLTRKNIT